MKILLAAGALLLAGCTPTPTPTETSHPMHFGDTVTYADGLAAPEAAAILGAARP